MQGPNHLATGILIQKALKEVRPMPIQYFLIAFLSIMSNGILDKLTRFTYHPSMPITRDWFWVSYHFIIAFLFIFMFVKYWGKYKLGIIFSVLPDFDWVVIHLSNFLSFQIPFWKEAILHKFFFGFLDFLLPFSFLNSLPNLSLDWKGAILEFAFFSNLIILIREKVGFEEKDEGDWRKWIKEVEKGKLLGIWSLGTKKSQLIAVGWIGLVIAIVFSLSGVYWALLLCSVFLMISGIAWLLHSSWLSRESWKLKEKRKVINDKKSRKEIETAMDYLDVHRDIDKIWGTVLIIIAGTIMGLTVSLKK